MMKNVGLTPTAGEYTKTLDVPKSCLRIGHAIGKQRLDTFQNRPFSYSRKESESNVVVMHL